MKLFYSFVYIFLASIVYCHSVNNKQLLYVEPLSHIKLDIASRSTDFFEKRKVSQNYNYQPNLKSLTHEDTLRLTLQVYNKTIYLHLVPNLDLFHPNAVIHQDGISKKLDPSDYRVYKGYAIDHYYSDHWWLSGLKKDHHDMENQPGILGWARIMIRQDIKHNLDYPLIEGVFSLNHDIHHIKLKDHYHLTKRSDDATLLMENHKDIHMVIYRDSDTTILNNLNQSTFGCGFDQLSHPTTTINTFFDNSIQLSSTLDQSLFHPVLSKRAPKGCPTTQKVLYMGAAADCTYVKFYQSSDKARAQIINNWNSVSSVYLSSFNVGLGLINITLMDSTCPTIPVKSTNWNQQCSTAYSISTRLSDFSKWRGTIGNDGAGLWHLMTNCATGSEVGIAWMSQVCTTKSIYSSSTGEYTSGTGVSSIIRDEWKVVAHEIGHGFGAIHDCTASTCPCSGSSCGCCPLSSTQCDAGGKYFMNPTSNASSSAFSTCSINTICNAMSSYNSCLETPGTKNITTLQMCGNGIVETGEDCDTGGQDSQCCNSSTCKFKSGAVCDDFNDACCDKCQVRPANYTCRPASTECDLEEVCDGLTGKCPEDKYKADLTSCGNGLKCAAGLCTSRDKQCEARGTTYGITKACGSESSCAITCQSPESILSCIVFPGYFSDGTPCGIAGVCKSGKCDTANAGSNIKNWIDTHLQIFIPVVVVAGLLLISCCFSTCCYSRRSGYKTMNESVVYIPGSQPVYYQPPQPYPPQPYPPQPYSAPPQGWVDPSLYNGPSNPQAAPVYSQRDTYELNDASQWSTSNYYNQNQNRPVGNR